MGKDSRFVRLSVAVVAAFLAWGVRMAFGPMLGPASDFLLFVPFVVFSAWYGGLKPGLLTTSVVVLFTIFLPVHSGPKAEVPLNPVHLALFLFGASAICSAMQSVRAERQRAQNAEWRLTSVLESTGDAVFSVDPELRITYANKLAAQLAKKSAGALRGRSLRTVFPETPSVVLYRELGRILREQTHDRFEDGLEQSHRWFSFNVYPVRSGLNLFVTDITAATRLKLDKTYAAHERHR